MAESHEGRGGRDRDKSTASEGSTVVRVRATFWMTCAGCQVSQVSGLRTDAEPHIRVVLYVEAPGHTGLYIRST
jgi:hypothetical protein